MGVTEWITSKRREHRTFLEELGTEPDFGRRIPISFRPVSNFSTSAWPSYGLEPWSLHSGVA